MNWFRCKIRGENFPGELAGENHLTGFLTTQYVKAASPQDAELAGLARLKQHPSLKMPPSAKKNSSARVYFEQIEQVNVDDVDATPMGLIFYPMDDASPSD